MARTNDVWETGIGGGYITTINPAGFDILINGSNHYLNFGIISGVSGYGIRDNGGTIEFKNSGGSWSPLSGGGGTGTVTSVGSLDGSILITNSATTPDLSVISAPKLTTPRAINGVNFDGSAAITVTAAAGTLTGTALNSSIVTSSLTSVGTITSGTWTGATIAIANGGSGQTTANAALNAFLPSQTGNSGQFLTTNGTSTSWATVGGSGTVTNVASADGSITVTNPATTVDLSVVKAPIWSTARLLAGNSVNGSANVAFANKFIVQGTADAGLSAAQFMGALGTGIIKNTTTTGVFSIAIAADFPTLNQNTSGSAATLTTGRTISITGDLSYTSPSFDGSGNVTAAGTLATVNSNTGSFGSATAAATFTVNGKGLLTAAGSTTITPAVGSITGLGTGIATFLATPSSANLIAAVTDETGTGALVFGTSPTLTTAILGSSTATTQSPSDNSTKVATTAYVDAAVLGQNFKEAARVATTANLVGVYLSGVFTYTATGTDTIDGVSLALGDRVLVKNQSTTFQNGIYSVTTAGGIGVAGVLTRSADANSSGQFKTGDSLFVTSGTSQSATTWAYSGNDSPVLGTDPITYVQAAGQGSFTSGNGITITGNSIAINTGVTVDLSTAQTLTNKNLAGAGNTFPTFNQNTSGSAASLSAVLVPASGGTGIANNNASTWTISGNFGTTVTVTATTAVTLPTSGTLVSLVTTANGVSASNTAGALSFTLGAITPTTVNGLTISTTTGTLTMTNAKALSVTNSITLSGTDATVMTFPTTTATIARTDAGQTFTGTQIMTSPKILTSILDTNGNTMALFGTTASAVNWLKFTNSATTVGPILSSEGETNVDLLINGKGSGKVTLRDSTDNSKTVNFDLSGATTAMATSFAFVQTSNRIITIPDANDTLVGKSTTDTLANKRNNPRTTNVASSATPSPNIATEDAYNLTALAVGATFAVPGGTPVGRNQILIRIKDNGSAQTLAWNAVYRVVGVTLPTTTISGKVLYVLAVYNAQDSVWDVIATGQQA